MAAIPCRLFLNWFPGHEQAVTTTACLERVPEAASAPDTEDAEYTSSVRPLAAVGTDYKQTAFCRSDKASHKAFFTWHRLIGGPLT